MLQHRKKKSGHRTGRPPFGPFFGRPMAGMEWRADISLYCDPMADLSPPKPMTTTMAGYIIDATIKKPLAAQTHM